MPRYSFSEGPVALKNANQADAQIIGQELERITRIYNGQLYPQAVVRAAEDPASPLHKHFEWDDPTAAESWRLHQARQLIRIVRVDLDEVDAEDRAAKRAWLSITTGSEGRSYRHVSDVITSGDLQLRVLQQAERDLAAWERRYRELEEVCDLVRVARFQLHERASAQARRRRSADEQPGMSL